jgi:SHS2 domain-containing protein
VTPRAHPRDDEPGTHELLDHTSEITIRLRAPTFPALVAEATRAFADLVPPELRREADPASREFRVKGTDRAGALVEWLNEMVYLSEAEQWLPVEVHVTCGEDDELRIRTRGVALEAPFVLVKAATLHNATVQESAEGLEGEVTLDL